MRKLWPGWFLRTSHNLPKMLAHNYSSDCCSQLGSCDLLLVAPFLPHPMGLLRMPIFLIVFSVAATILVQPPQCQGVNGSLSVQHLIERIWEGSPAAKIVCCHGNLAFSHCCRKRWLRVLWSLRMKNESIFPFIVTKACLSLATLEWWMRCYRITPWWRTASQHEAFYGFALLNYCVTLYLSADTELAAVDKLT